MRWIFGHIEIGSFSKTTTGSTFSHPTSDMTNNRMLPLADADQHEVAGG